MASASSYAENARKKIGQHLVKEMGYSKLTPKKYYRLGEDILSYVYLERAYLTYVEIGIVPLYIPDAPSVLNGIRLQNCALSEDCSPVQANLWAESVIRTLTQGALAFMEEWAFKEAEKLMKYARAVMKTGLYRLMPFMCEWMLDRMFGEKAGFEYRRVPGAPRFAADMLRCPYVDTCAKYGCPELAQFSCRADDITYGNLHPKLVWGRTQTMGTGGSCCDFRLYIREKQK